MKYIVHNSLYKKLKHLLYNKRYSIDILNKNQYDYCKTIPINDIFRWMITIARSSKDNLSTGAFQSDIKHFWRNSWRWWQQNIYSTSFGRLKYWIVEFKTESFFRYLYDTKLKSHYLFDIYFSQILHYFYFQYFLTKITLTIKFPTYCMIFRKYNILP